MNRKYGVISFVAGNCYSYFITDSEQAILVDPHISLVEKYGRRLNKKRLSLVGIVDTHTHADHISSAAVLKKRYDVPLYMSEHAVSSVATEKLKDGDVIKVGKTEVTSIYTPGHTDDSVSLLTQQGDLLTGDVLLINSVGRTDFQNGSPEDMFDSLGKLVGLPEETVVRPAHDYKGKKFSTIAEQKKTNPFLLEKDKVKFCDNARSKKLVKPSNMDTIIIANQKGTVEGFSKVSPKKAFERLAEQDSVLLDVRTDQELREISVNVDNVKHAPLQSLASSVGSLASEISYYVICRSGHRATMAAMLLLQEGFAKVAVIEGGITAWEKAKLPIKKSATAISIERQVRIIAGCLILIGSLLSLVNIWFIVIPLFVGAGLVFAGVSNNCLMALLLIKLPYNIKSLSAGQGGCSMDDGGCSM
jgi:glyoxylase-like metal-dependent hydrolase (beta-lactamase superfamily II)/rhodanese-related sulfurtransferase